MKRIKIILLLCFTVFVLCGCSKKDKASEIKGKIEGNEYVNTFANIRIKAPDGFTFLSEEELNKTINTSSLSDDEKEGFKEFTDCLLKNEKTGSNYIVVFENLEAEVPDPSAITADYYVSVVEKSLTSQMSSDYTVKAKDTTVIGGDEYCREWLTMKQSFSFNNDISYSQTILVKKVGNYIVEIVYTQPYLDENPITENEVYDFQKYITGA